MALVRDTADDVGLPPNCTLVTVCNIGNGTVGLEVRADGTTVQKMWESEKGLMEEADVVYFIADDAVACDTGFFVQDLLDPAAADHPQLPFLVQPYSSGDRSIKQRERIRRLQTRRYLAIDVAFRNSIMALPTACGRRAALESRYNV